MPQTVSIAILYKNNYRPCDQLERFQRCFRVVFICFQSKGVILLKINRTRFFKPTCCGAALLKTGIIECLGFARFTH